jgi:hypothetical protein
MKSIHMLTIAATLLFSGSTLAAEPATCSAANFDYRQYEIFIDAPTGYAYIKTPCGWHFVRQIEADKVAKAIEVAARSTFSPTDGDLRVSLLQSRMK